MSATEQRTDWAETEARLRENMDRDHAPAWLPEDGDEIIGVLVDFQPSVYTAFGNVPVVTLEGPNGGRKSVWLHHQVLRGAFIRSNVQYGETVAIRYVGKVEPKGDGPRYADYKLVVDRTQGKSKVDWAGVASTMNDAVRPDADVQPTTEDLPSARPPDDDIPF